MKLFTLLSSLRLSLVLFCLLVCDLLLGWYSVAGNGTFYQSMNRTGLWQWLMTSARTDLFLSAWFFLLLLLLSCFVINTLCCTGQRLWRMARSLRRGRQGRRFRASLAIHLMHLALALLFTGYLLSYTTAEVFPSLVIQEGGSCTLPTGHVRVTLEKMTMIPYTAGRIPAFAGRYLDSEALLRITGGGEEKRLHLSLNTPAQYGGWSLFLRRFNPRKEGRSFSSAKYIIIDARRDAGIPFTFCGMALFTLGLCGWLLFRTRSGRTP